MVFTAPIFLFVFLPLFLVAYYLTPARFRSVIILLGSSVFYAWWRVDFLILLYAIIGGTWVAAIYIDRWRDTIKAKRLMQTTVVANLLTLGYFKYWNFGLNSFQLMMTKAGIDVPTEFVQVLLPIGISFFVFHAISYIIDVWRRDTPPTRNLFDFAAFIMLFPHLIAGPVLRYKDLAWQFTSRTHSMALFSEGAYRFMSGFAKKVLIADTIAPLADAAFALENPTMLDSTLGIIAYTIQLYFDFSGYSDMAIGLALMMGFRFVENFNTPYISRSITEFWRRWHISLSNWLRDYLYIPLGGNRKGSVRTAINVFLTMLLGGLWHGANWTFILWGAWHGAIMAIERFCGVDPDAPLSFPKNIITMIATLLAVMIGWGLFRAENLSAAMNFYAGMLGTNGIAISDSYAWQIKGMALTALAAGIALVFIQPHLNKTREIITLSKASTAMKLSPGLTYQILVAALFVAAVSRVIAMSYSPFLYFQF